MTFIDYLTEVMVDVNPDDPAEATKAARNATRMGAQRTAMANRKQAKADMEASQASGEEDPEVKRLNRLKMLVAQSEQRLAQKKDQANTAAA